MFAYVLPLFDCFQALVSPFLLDDTAEDLDESFQNQSLGIFDSVAFKFAFKTSIVDILYGFTGDELTDQVPDFGRSNFNSYDYLKDLDPVAANRIHPNNHRKVEIASHFLL